MSRLQCQRRGGSNVSPNQPVVRLRIRLLLAALLLAPVLAQPIPAAPRLDGLWDAIVVVNGVEIPFRFELATRGSRVEGFFFEGDRKIGSTAGSFENGVLKLEYEFLNTTLEATVE